MQNELGQPVTSQNGEPKQEPDSPLGMHDGDTPPPGHKGDMDGLDCSPSPPPSMATHNMHHPQHHGMMGGGGHLAGIYPELKLNYSMMHGLATAGHGGPNMAAHMGGHPNMHHNSLGAPDIGVGGDSVHMNNNTDVNHMINEYHAL